MNYIIRYKLTESDVVFKLRKELDILWYETHQEVMVLNEEKTIQNSTKINKLLNKQKNWEKLNHKERKKLSVWFKWARKQQARFDLVINRKLIIEVKKKWKRKWLTKQVQRYKDYNMDIITCVWLEEMEDTIKQVQEYF